MVITHEKHDPTLGRTHVVFLRPSEFKVMYQNVMVRTGNGNEVVDAAEWWLAHKHRRDAKNIVFDPTDKSPQFFNLWRGFSVEPKEKDCQRFLDFIREVICDGDDEMYQYIIGYFAHMIQLPWDLPETALILHGEQGTGKSFVIKQFAALIAEHSTTISQRRHLVGGFNAHMANSILVIADEISIATKFATNAMKAPITEPYLMLEPKGHDAIPIKNCIRYVLLTNDPHVALIDPKERRFAVYKVNNTHQQDHAFFAGLAQYMEDGGLEGLMYFLKNHDLSNFNIRKVPRSKGFAEQVAQSLSDVERFWHERLEEGELEAGKGWPREIEKRRLTIEYQNYCDGIGLRKRSAETQLGRKLLQMCPSIRQTRPAGKRHYVLPTLEEARKCFENHTGINWEWPE